MSREERIGETFVELADTLVADFDVVELLHTLANRCVELADVDAAGIMLADHNGTLQVVGSSSEQVRLLELLEIQHEAGPCVESYRTGRTVTTDLADPEQWPTLRDAALESGFHSVIALPMRLRNHAIGAMNLFRTEHGELSERDLAICRALADIATIGLLQERAIREARLLADQLQHALNTRVVVEQAKGILAERGTVDMDVAFTRLRSYARSHNTRIGEVARAVIDGRLGPDAL